MRGRTSTASTGMVRPVNSSHSTISRCSTGATVTAGAGGRDCTACRLQPAIRTLAAPSASDSDMAWRKDCGLITFWGFEVCAVGGVVSGSTRLNPSGFPDAFLMLDPIGDLAGFLLRERRKHQLGKSRLPGQRLRLVERELENVRL